MPVENGEASSEKKGSSCCYDEVINYKAQTSEISQGTLSLDLQHVRSENISIVIKRARSTLYTRLNELVSAPESRENTGLSMKYRIDDCVGKEEDFLSTEHGPIASTRVSTSSRIHPWRRLNVYDQHRKRVMSYNCQRDSQDSAISDELLSKHFYATVKLGYACPPVEPSDDETAHAENADRDRAFSNVSKGESRTNTDLDTACPCPLNNNDHLKFPIIIEGEGNRQSNSEDIHVSDSNFECTNRQLKDITLEGALSHSNETAIIYNEVECENEFGEDVTMLRCSSPVATDFDRKCEDFDNSEAPAPDDMADLYCTSSTIDYIHRGNGSFEATAKDTAEISQCGNEEDCVSDVVAKMVQFVCDSILTANVNGKHNDLGDIEVSVASNMSNSDSLGCALDYIPRENGSFEATAIDTVEISQYGSEEDCVIDVVAKMVQSVCLTANVNEKRNDLGGSEVSAASNMSNSDSLSCALDYIHRENVLAEIATNNDREIPTVGLQKDCILKIVEEMVQSVCDSPFDAHVDERSGEYATCEVSESSIRRTASGNVTDVYSTDGYSQCQGDCSINESLYCVDKLARSSSELNADNDSDHGNPTANEVLIGDMPLSNSCSADYCYDHPHCEDCERNRLEAPVDLDDNHDMHTDVHPKSWYDNGLHFDKGGGEIGPVPAISVQKNEEHEVFQCTDYRNSSEELQAESHERQATGIWSSNEDENHQDVNQSFQSEHPDLTESIQTEICVGEMVTVRESLHNSLNRSDSVQQDHELDVWQPCHVEEAVPVLSAEECEYSDSDKSLYIKQENVGGSNEKDETLDNENLWMTSIAVPNSQDLDSSSPRECKHKVSGSDLKKPDMVAKTVTDVLSVILKGHEPEVIAQCNESKLPDLDLNFKSDHAKLQNFTSQPTFSTLRSSETKPTQTHSMSNVEKFQIIPAEASISGSRTQELNEGMQPTECRDPVKSTVSHCLVPTIRLPRPVDREPKKTPFQARRLGFTEIVKLPVKSASGKMHVGTKLFKNNSHPGKTAVLFVRSTSNITPIKATFVASVAVVPNLCPSSPPMIKRETLTEHNTTTNSIPDILPTISVTHNTPSDKGSLTTLTSNLCPTSPARDNGTILTEHSYGLNKNDIPNILPTNSLPETCSSCKPVVAVFAPNFCLSSNSTAMDLVDVPPSPSVMTAHPNGKTDIVSVSPNLGSPSRDAGTAVSEYNYESMTNNISNDQITPFVSDSSPSSMAALGSQSLGIDEINDNSVTAQSPSDVRDISTPEKEVILEYQSQNKDESNNSVLPQNQLDKESFAESMVALNDQDCSKCTKCVSCGHGSPSNVDIVINDIPDKVSQLTVPESETKRIGVEIHENITKLSSPTELPEQNADVDQNNACTIDNTLNEESQKLVEKIQYENTGFNRNENVIVACYIDDSLSSHASGLESLDTSLSLEDGIIPVNSQCSPDGSKIDAEGNEDKTYKSIHPKDHLPDEDGVMELCNKLTCEKAPIEPANARQTFHEDEDHSSCIEIAEITPVEVPRARSEDLDLKPADHEELALLNTANGTGIIHPTHLLNNISANCNNPQLSTVSVQMGSTELLKTEVHLPVECEEDSESGDYDDKVETIDANRVVIRPDCDKDSCHDNSSENDGDRFHETIKNTCVATVKDDIDYSSTSHSGTSDVHVESAVAMNDSIDIVETVKANAENVNNTKLQQLDLENTYIRRDDLTMGNFDDAKQSVQSYCISSNGENKEFKNNGISTSPSPIVHIEESLPCKFIDATPFQEGLEITEIRENSGGDFTCSDSLVGYHCQVVDATVSKTDDITRNDNKIPEISEISDRNFKHGNSLDSCYSQTKDTPARENEVVSSNGNELSLVGGGYSMVQQQDFSNAPVPDLNHLSMADVFQSVEESGDKEKTKELDANVPVIREVVEYDVLHGNDASRDVDIPEYCPRPMDSEPTLSESILSHESMICHSSACNCESCKNREIQSATDVDSTKHTFFSDTVDGLDNYSTGVDSTLLPHIDIFYRGSYDEAAGSSEIPQHFVERYEKDGVNEKVVPNPSPRLQLEDIRSNIGILTSEEAISSSVKSRSSDFDEHSQILDESNVYVVFQSLPKSMVEEAHAFVKPIVETICGHETCPYVKRTNVSKAAKLSNPLKRRRSVVCQNAKVADWDWLEPDEKCAKPKRKRASSLCSMGNDGERPVGKKKGRSRKKAEITSQFLPITMPNDLRENICPNVSSNSVFPRQPSFSCALSTKSVNSSCTYTFSSVGDGKAALNYNVSTSFTKPKHNSTRESCNTAEQFITDITPDASSDHRSQSILPPINLSARLSARSDVNGNCKTLKQIPRHLEPLLSSPPKYIDEDVKLQKRTRVSITPMERDGNLPPISAGCRFDLKLYNNVQDDASQCGYELEQAQCLERLSPNGTNVNVSLENNVIPEIHEVTTVMRSSPILCSKSKSVFYSNAVMGVKKKYDPSRLCSQMQNSVLSSSTFQLHSSTPTSLSPTSWSLHNKPNDVNVEGQVANSQPLVTDLAVAHMQPLVSKIEASNKSRPSTSSSLVESKKNQKPDLHGQHSVCYKSAGTYPTSCTPPERHSVMPSQSSLLCASEDSQCHNQPVRSVLLDTSPNIYDCIRDLSSKSQNMLLEISCKGSGFDLESTGEDRSKFHSRKADQSELPFSLLNDRDQRDLYKCSGKTFVQDAPCFDIARMYGVETSGPQFGDQSWRKCRECRSVRRRESASVFCRFYGFRKLRFKDNLLCTAGFLQPDECSIKDLQLWLPRKSCFNQSCAENMNVFSPADPFETEIADFILANIGKRFCEIARIENNAKSWIADDETIHWKKPVPGVRDLCDVCETTLFNIHWICPKCGYGVCLDCFDRRQQKSHQEQKAYDSKVTNSFRWGRCVKGQNHIHYRMVPTQIIPSTCLEDLNAMIHDICKTRKIQTSCRCQEKMFPQNSKVSTNTVVDHSTQLESSVHIVENGHSVNRKRRASDGGVDSRLPKKQKLAKRSSSTQDTITNGKLTSSLQPSIRLIDFLDDSDAPQSDEEENSTKSPEGRESNRQSSEAQLQWLCDGRLLQLTDSQHPGNLEIFKTHWKHGIPIVVSGVGKYLDMRLWHPMRLSSEYGDEESKNSLINCLTGSIVTNMRIKDFWDGFENISNRLCDEENKTMILKLKDWPPTEAFHDVMPEMFEDLMGALPLPEYTFIGGICNLASRLPQFFVKPDLGPKMYNAYGWVTETNWKQGTTNLHLDISDAVNVMVYVGIPHDEPEEAKERLLRIVDEADVDEIQRRRAINEKPGALWHIFHERDVDKIRKFIKSVWMESGEVDAADNDPIHDQQMYLDRGLRRRLKEEYGVVGCGIVQCEGDGVFIPAGAPHQVFNLHSCIKIAEDFVSPEHVDKCFNLTNEFRYLSSTHSNHEDKLQIKNIIYHAVKDIASTALHPHCSQR